MIDTQCTGLTDTHLVCGGDGAGRLCPALGLLATEPALCLISGGRGKGRVYSGHRLQVVNHAVAVDVCMKHIPFQRESAEGPACVQMQNLHTVPQVSYQCIGLHHVLVLRVGSPA